MKIQKGDKLEEITLPKHDGKIFNLSETKGKKVLLTFYRIAGCTFCNLRLLEFNKRYGEFGQKFIHVGIFSSNQNILRTNMKKHGPTPFIILADENFKYFEKFKIERSWSKLLLTIIFKSYAIFPALLRGFIPLPPFGGYFDIAVTDIMINEKGIVEDVLYAKKHAADHFSFDKVKEFSLS